MFLRFSGGVFWRRFSRFAVVPLFIVVCLFSSCARRLGYGILLWAVVDPPIPSGTVLPVYIRSNIDQVWVAGIPKEYRGAESKIDKFEIPLAKLELAGSRKNARARAEELAPYALTYAETLQDGLPIRESPENNARRSYRLKQGEIIKILAPARGQAAIGTTGDPLPGEWFEVLAEDGTTGYCFSYRLKLFEYSGGVLASAPVRETAEDPELDRVLTRAWVAEDYGAMVNSRRFNLGELSERWGFDPGQDTGIAVIKTKEVERSFSYTAIRPTGTRSWRFEGAPLQMELRSDTTLAVQFTESGGILRALLFVVLPSTIDDLIVQETARRDELFNSILRQGPAFTSHNYGTISFSEGGRFNWTGFELLVPQVIPETVIGNGRVDMRLFLSRALSDRYAGAFTLRFEGVNNNQAEVDFMYAVDNQGFRLEYVPDTSRDGIVVNRRSSTPHVLYFFRAEPAPQYTAEPYHGSEPQYGSSDPFSYNPAAPYPSTDSGGYNTPAPDSFPLFNENGNAIYGDDFPAYGEDSGAYGNGNDSPGGGTADEAGTESGTSSGQAEQSAQTEAPTVPAADNAGVSNAGALPEAGPSAGDAL